MAQNNNINELKCQYCFYTTNKKFNLIRHQNAKHKDILSTLQNVILEEQDVILNEQNVIPEIQDVRLKEQNVIPEDKNKLICSKCNKIYLTQRHLKNHELKCNKVDILTCPRCMKSFSCRQNKNKHIKRDTCKPRSIIHARTPNIQNIITNNNNNNTNIETQNNIEINGNVNSNNTNTNFIINNYGNERLDYLDNTKFIEIFKKCYDIPSALAKEIHFNNDFPENKNIKDYNKTTALIKTDDNFIMKDKELLVDEIIKNKTRMINKFAILNKELICQKMDNGQYYEIIEVIINFLIKEPKEQYRNQFNKIKDLIRNTC
jgi:uncharacterized protein YbaR (Trm112 family)